MSSKEPQKLPMDKDGKIREPASPPSAPPKKVKMEPVGGDKWKR